MPRCCHSSGERERTEVYALKEKRKEEKRNKFLRRR